MFNVDYETMQITMDRGDTGSFPITARSSLGMEWTEDDRLIFTVANQAREVIMQRYYRLDDERTSVDLPNGVVLIEFHNGDTDWWTPGQYSTEVRVVRNAVWDGDPEEDDMVDATLGNVSRITDGIPVRTTLKSSLVLSDIIGEV